MKQIISFNHAPEILFYTLLLSSHCLLRSPKFSALRKPDFPILDLANREGSLDLVNKNTGCSVTPEFQISRIELLVMYVLCSIWGILF